jgi:hypothetical protein
MTSEPAACAIREINSGPIAAPAAEVFTAVSRNRRRVHFDRGFTEYPPPHRPSPSETTITASARQSGLPARPFTPSSTAKKPGIASHPGTGMGMISADYDDDGYPDIFVANYVRSFRNQPTQENDNDYRP